MIVNCPSCGGGNPPWARRCARCGVSLDDPVPIDAAPIDAVPTDVAPAETGPDAAVPVEPARAIVAADPPDIARDAGPASPHPAPAWTDFTRDDAPGSGLGGLLQARPPSHGEAAAAGPALPDLGEAAVASDSDPRLPDKIELPSSSEPSLGSLGRNFELLDDPLPEPRLDRPALPDHRIDTAGPEFDPPPLPTQRPAPAAALELPARPSRREWLAPLLVVLVLVAGIGAFLAVWMSAPDGGGLDPAELLARARARLAEWGLVAP